MLEGCTCKFFIGMFGFKYGLYHQVFRAMHSSVTKFYDGQSAFITGGTGFIGKVLLEKLLYQCHGLQKVYILIRKREDMKPHERLQKVFDEPVFSRLRNERPEAFEKVVPIIGDVSLPKIGIKPEDEKHLTDTVSVVFHIAATVKYTEPLDVAMNINVNGTERVLDLCQHMKCIKSFVYISTAYSIIGKKNIEEMIYPAPASLDEVNKTIENGISEVQVKRLLNKHPNTYTFTKALAETLINDKHRDIPTVIIRPTIVTSSVAEPMVGWIDSWLGSTGLISMVGKGYNRVIRSKPSHAIDLIPVDYVSNLTIVAATTTTKCNPDNVTVYNCATSKENPIRLDQLISLIITDSYKNKANDLPFLFVHITSYKWVVSFITLIFQTIPGHIADTILLLRGRKQRYRNIFSRITQTRDGFQYFTCRNWVIYASKTKALAESLSLEDKKYFPFNPTDINWKDYIPSYCTGIRQFMLKEINKNTK